MGRWMAKNVPTTNEDGGIKNDGDVFIERDTLVVHEIKRGIERKYPDDIKRQPCAWSLRKNSEQMVRDQGEESMEANNEGDGQETVQHVNSHDGRWRVGRLR